MTHTKKKIRKRNVSESPPPPPPPPPGAERLFQAWRAARHRGIWNPGPPFSQILDPPLYIIVILAMERRCCCRALSHFRSYNIAVTLLSLEKSFGVVLNITCSTTFGYRLHFFFFQFENDP